MWTGSGWQSLGNFNNSTVESFGVDVLTEYNSRLFAGGYFWDINGQRDSLLCTYNGTTWNQVDVNLTARGVAYYTSYVWNGSLYLGGVFNIAAEGGNTAVNIVEYNIATGINSLALPSEPFIYPNPASNGVVIANVAPGSQMVIKDVLGQTILRVTASSARQSIDVSSLSSGMYFVNGAKFIKE